MADSAGRGGGQMGVAASRLLGADGVKALSFCAVASLRAVVDGSVVGGFVYHGGSDVLP